MSALIAIDWLAILSGTKASPKLTQIYFARGFSAVKSQNKFFFVAFSGGAFISNLREKILDVGVDSD